MWYTYTMKYNSYGNEKKTPIKFSKMNKSHNTEYEKPEIYIYNSIYRKLKMNKAN